MSLARTAGVTGELSNSRSRKVKRVVGAGRHQHDVDQARPRDQPHLVAIFLERLEADLAGVHLGRAPGAPRPSAMSASLASAMMNSRQPGSAWIAASLRSSDFSMVSAPSLSGDGDARATRRRRCRRRRPSSPAPGCDAAPFVVTFGAAGVEAVPGLALPAALGLLL